MTKRECVSTARGPAAIGPYSQAIVAGEFVFVSGQIPLDPATGRLSASEVVPQTEQVMRNIAAILEAAGSSFDRVVKTTIFLADLKDFEAVNAVYGRAFAGEPPARSTVQVAALPRGALLEIEVVALRKG